MVRVITVHNFVNQHVQVVEQPTASTVAPPDRLLLALNNHCVEVRDLKCESNVLFTFPTVDQVRQLLHCLNGNYVATLESKVNRQNRQINYARVYVNWDSIATLQQSKMTSSGASLDSSECGMVQPMRARIAGRVTPTTNQSELGNLEMIEIPAKGNPCNVACCQISGNLLVQSGKTLFVYGFQVKTHDISKLKFLDFEELPLHIELAFVPVKITLCENYIACLNQSNIHMFKVIWKLSAPEKNKETEKCDINFKVSKENVTIDYKELLRRERANKKEEKITVNLPSIVKSNSLIHKHSPFTFIDKEMNALVKLNYPLEDKTHKYELVHLIQLRLKPIIIENTRSQVVEEFKCLVLHPLYCEGSKCAADGGVPRVLKSGFRGCLKEVVCVITTLQEGYLFQFCDAELDTNLDNCISVYPFMGPVYSVALEGHLLHALTETGLETYTVRVGHQLCRSLEETDAISNVCPPKEQLLCLIGHRQFIGIEQMLITDNYLVLLANGDNSPTHSIGSNSSSNTSTWTLYALELPTPKMIFTDIAIAANAHRFSAPQTYCHLISEAHMILRLALHVVKWEIREGNVCSLVPVKNNTDELLDAYHTSCCLLGDHFVINECKYQLCLPYYKMAGMIPHEVLKRFRRIQEESNAEEMRGIVYYLKVMLREPRLKAPDNLSEAAWKQSFIEDVLQIFHRQAYLDLSYLIIKNGILREYCTHKLINVLRDQSFADPYRETERLLALGLLHMQEYNLDKAKVVLSEISDSDSLLSLLEENWHLLFERLSKHKRSLVFSEFAVILMMTHCDILSNTFNYLIRNEKVTLHDILLMFMEYLQMNMGSDGLAAARVMRTMLEDYFKFYFSHYESVNIGQFSAIAPSSLQLAMTVLVRSYLSQLQVFQLKEANNPQQIHERICGNDTDEEKRPDESPLFPNGVPKRNAKSYLFANQRYEYLDKMPPFQIEITSKLYEKCVENYVAADAFAPNEEADLILQKLQALLCSGVLPEEAIVEAKTFLSVNNTLRGYTSLMSILINKNDVVNYLLNSCPQCLLQYGKDCFMNDEEWQAMVTNTQTKIIHLSVDEDLNRICFFYKKILKDVLTHLATTLSVEDFQKVLPNRRIDNDDHEEYTRDEIYSYDTYLTICKETTQANQIKKLITTTGHQLLRTLNL